mgnify:FL=1
MTETFDIAIVGAGITGCTIARQLARYDLSICVIEAANDIALGASKANGGLVHAGYDPAPGTVKAQVNARGCELYGTGPGAGVFVLPNRFDGAGLQR